MKHLVHKLVRRSMWSRRDGIAAGIVCAILGLSALMVALSPSPSPPSTEQVVSAPLQAPATPAPSPQPRTGSDDSTAVARQNAPEQPVAEPAGRPPSNPDTRRTETANSPETAIPLADLVGTWRLQDRGERVVTIRDDGSALMQVVLDFVSSLLYGESMTLELEWTLEGDILTHRIVRGQPEENVARLIRDFGDARSYRVVSCGDELVLESVESPGEIYRWTAVTNQAATDGKAGAAVR